MQTLTQIREMLAEADLKPQRRLGQCFLIDGNLMGKLLDLAKVPPGQVVLEVGAGTGALTGELLARGARVVAVEVDGGLCRLLQGRLGGREGLILIEGSAMVRKTSLSPVMLQALPPMVHMVANLPYNIATPLVAECLVSSWRAQAGQGGCTFERLTFTVQQELADRLAASPGGGDYGPVSVLVELLGRVKLANAVPATAFWPVPKVDSRIVRIDFARGTAATLTSVEMLRKLLTLAFGQRRKQIGSILRRKKTGFRTAALRGALAAAGINPTLRPEAVTPAQYLVAANALDATTTKPASSRSAGSRS